MKKNLLVYFLHTAATATSILLLSGCASNGYITSSINTGIGLDVSENPQTQVPHVKFGYIRSGLYYIPTGKTGNPKDGDASQTPHIVSKIHVSSEFLKNIDITEKFAVGDAVSTAAAHQLFLDTSSETKNSVGGRSTPPVVGPDTAPIPQRREITNVPEKNQLIEARHVTQEVRKVRDDIVARLNKLGKPGAAASIITAQALTAAPGDSPEVTVCKAILAKAAAATPPVTGITETIHGINLFQRDASPEQLVSLDNAMKEIIK